MRLYFSNQEFKAVRKIVKFVLAPYSNFANNSKPKIALTCVERDVLYKLLQRMQKCYDRQEHDSSDSCESDSIIYGEFICISEEPIPMEQDVLDFAEFEEEYEERR